MSNIYVIVSNDSYLINEEKEKLIKSSNIDQFNISSYNFRMPKVYQMAPD